MPDETKLAIKINNAHPVELLDLTKSLTSLADEYSRYLPQSDHPFAPDDIKLFVKEIKTGSIIAELVALAPIGLPFIENANTIFGFAKHLGTAFDYLKGTRKEKPPLSKTSYQNIANILEPIAKDNGSNVVIQTIVNGNATFNHAVNHLEANAIQNKAYREIEALNEPTTGIREKVLLYWYQARNDLNSQAGDKAIIESIYKGPVKTIFANDRIKAKMVLDDENPFKEAYIVDVAIETINGKPVLYKILELHEKFDKPVQGTIPI